MQPENMYLLVHHHHYRVALACDYQPYCFALWRDHELILSRAVGMTFCRVWRGIWGNEGPRGKDSGALDARPFATRRVFHGVPNVRHPCTVRPCGEGRSGSSPQIRVRKKRHAENCPTPRPSPLERNRKAGAVVLTGPNLTLVSGIASSLCQIVKTDFVVVTKRPHRQSMYGIADEAEVPG